MINKQMKLTKGFSMVELLIVMAIISILTIGTIAGLSFGMRQARDSQRRAMLDNLTKALTAYYQENNFYPGPERGSVSCNYTVSSTDFKFCEGAFFDGDLINSALVIQLSPYFENKFDKGTIDSMARRVGYYIKDTTGGQVSEYALCAVMEGTSPSYTNGPTDNANSAGNHCYCIGSQSAAAINCNSLEAY